MRKTYIIPKIETLSAITEQPIGAISKGYIQDPNGNTTDETIETGNNDEEGGAKGFNPDWDFDPDWNFDE